MSTDRIAVNGNIALVRVPTIPLPHIQPVGKLGFAYVPTTSSHDLSNKTQSKTLLSSAPTLPSKALTPALFTLNLRPLSSKTGVTQSSDFLSSLSNENTSRTIQPGPPQASISPDTLPVASTNIKPVSKTTFLVSGIPPSPQEISIKVNVKPVSIGNQLSNFGSIIPSSSTQNRLVVNVNPIFSGNQSSKFRQENPIKINVNPIPAGSQPLKPGSIILSSSGQENPVKVNVNPVFLESQPPKSGDIIPFSSLQNKIAVNVNPVSTVSQTFKSGNVTSPLSILKDPIKVNVNPISMGSQSSKLGGVILSSSIQSKPTVKINSSKFVLGSLVDTGITSQVSVDRILTKTMIPISSEPTQGSEKLILNQGVKVNVRRDIFPVTSTGPEIIQKQSNMSVVFFRPGNLDQKSISVFPILLDPNNIATVKLPKFESIIPHPVHVKPTVTVTTDALTTTYTKEQEAMFVIKHIDIKRLRSETARRRVASGEQPSYGGKDLEALVKTFGLRCGKRKPEMVAALRTYISSLGISLDDQTEAQNLG